MNFILKKLLLSLVIFPIVLFAQDSLKVLTYNIEGMKPGTNPGLRIAMIINELKEIDADIIGLQEINEDLNGDDSDNQGLRIKNALEEHFGTEYYYFQQQTHLSFNSASVRLQQIEQVDDYIIAINSSNGIVSNILTGDFNAIPGSPVIKYLTVPSEVYYFSSFQKSNPDMPGFTVPSNNPNAKIDFIFYTNKSTLSVDTSYIVMDEPLGEDLYFSDHLGVMSIFSYNDNTSIGELPQKNRKPIKLSSIKPNPCVNHASIDFEIYNKTNVKVSLFNLQGEELAILINEEKIPKKYTLYIDCSEFSENIYFLSFEADGIVETRKLVKLN